MQKIYFKNLKFIQDKNVGKGEIPKPGKGHLPKP